MKKNVVFIVAVLTAATIFAQEKKAVIGIADMATTISEATVEGYWGEYWGDPNEKGKIISIGSGAASSYTHMKTGTNTELKRPAEVPATLTQVKMTLQNMLFDYFEDSGLFERVVECNRLSEAEGVDYFMQASLDMLYLERGLFPAGSVTDVTVDARAIICVTVNVKPAKNTIKYPPMVFCTRWDDWINNISDNTVRESLKKIKSKGAYIDTQYIRNMNLTHPDGFEQTDGLLGSVIKAAVTKEKPKDDFLYEKNTDGLHRFVKNIIIGVYHKLNPPTVQAVDENGIITLSALGRNKKDVLKVMNGATLAAEIYVYDVDDRIAYAMVDPVDPEFAGAEIKEGFYVEPTDKEWQVVNNAIKNINKQVKAIKKAQKANAKAKK